MNNYSKLLFAALFAGIFALGSLPTAQAQTGSLPGAGTIVGPVDVDTTYRITSIPAPAMFSCFVDSNGNGGQDAGEAVYIVHAAACGATTVTAGSVRLTAASSFAGGTLVKGSDDDFSRNTVGIPAASAVCAFDADGNTVYSPGDVVYLEFHACGPIGINDIYLTGANSFTRVTATSPGFNTPSVSFAPPYSTGAIGVGGAWPSGVAGGIGFFDADGNAVYSVDDTVYLNINGAATTAAPSAAVPNVADVRLTKLGSLPGGMQLGPTDQEISYGLAAPVPAYILTAGGICFVDTNGDTFQSAGEPAYLQKAACGANSVGIADLRLTSANSFTGGTLVKGSDDDFSRNTIASVAATLDFFDSDGSGGFSTGDLVYIHFGAGTAVAINDIMLTGTGAFTRVTGSTVGLNNVGCTIGALGCVPTGPASVAAAVRFDADGFGGAAVTTGDFVYYDMDGVAPLSPSVNDIRLTKVGSLNAGSSVGSYDVDSTFVLAPITAPAFVAICFTDTNGDGLRDSTEPAYLHRGACAGGKVVAGDVRLSSAAPYTGGSIVRGSDDDFSRNLAAPAAAAFCFFDGNGNTAYNPGETIYAHFAAVPGTVAVNDIVLSGPNAFKSVQGVAEGLNNACIAGTLPAIGALTFYSADGIAGYTTGDVVYMDIDGNAVPTVGDLRVTGASNTGGSIGGGIGGGVGGGTNSNSVSGSNSVSSSASVSTSASVSSSAHSSSTTPVTPPTSTSGPKTPGFELVALVGALAVSLVLVRRKL